MDLPGNGNTNIMPPTGRPHLVLGTSNFIKLFGAEETYYIDKTLLIKAFFKYGRSRVLVTAPRRFGKTVNITMFKMFLQLKENVPLTEEMFQDSLQKAENYRLFYSNNLKIMNEEDIVKKHFGRYPVIHVLFKCESSITSYEEALKICQLSISNAFKEHYYLVNSLTLTPGEQDKSRRWCEGEISDKMEVLFGLQTLAEYLHAHFNKRVFILADEYDNIAIRTLLGIKDQVEMKRAVEDSISVIKNVVNEDNYVEWALITGISHIMGATLSGSNMVPCKFLGSHCFVPYYGLTEQEFDQLGTAYELNKEQIRLAKIRFGGYGSLTDEKMYSMWSLLRCAADLDSMEDTGVITGLPEALRISSIRQIIESELLLNQSITVRVQEIIEMDDILRLRKIITQFESQSLECLKPDIFFKFLLEQGYLSCFGGSSKNMLILI